MHPATPIWPDLPYATWRETAATLQLWTQIVGKVRLKLTPWLNHGWHVPLYVTARGLGTSPIPDRRRDPRDRVRFHRPPSRRPHQPGRGACAAPAAANGGRLLRPRARSPARPRRHSGYQRDAERGAKPDPLPAGPHACRLRRRRGAPLLARAAAGRPRLQAVPQRLPGQGEPGAFLLGQLRPCRHPLLGPHRAAPSRRRAGLPDRSRARPIRTRSAAPASGPAATPSRRPPSTPTPIPSRRASATGQCLRAPASSRRSASSSCPTTRSAPPPTPTPCCSTSCPPPTLPRPMRAAGTARRSNAPSASPPGAPV